MKLTNKDIVLQCMRDIEFLQNHVANIDAAVAAVHRAHRLSNVDCGTLRETLCNMELKQWRQMAMWGLTLDDDERDRIKAAVHERFLSDRMHVAEWFSDTGGTPGAWLHADEIEFRKMAKLAFGPKTDGGTQGSTSADQDGETDK